MLAVVAEVHGVEQQVMVAKAAAVPVDKTLAAEAQMEQMALAAEAAEALMLQADRDWETTI